MKVFFGLKNIKEIRRAVVALGVFDGVHRGHRRVLKAVVAKASSIGGTSLVLTFWPHPQKEESLYSLEHRLRLIAELGIDICIVINFTPKFAKIKPEDFIKDILLRKLKVAYVFVGENFRFGRNAKGNLKTLKIFSRVYNFRLSIFKVSKMQKKTISSSCIRSLIKKGDIVAAQSLLSRKVSIFGTVIRGASFGRRLGIPTANINPHHEILPPHGVYATSIIFNNRTYRGICYIGDRPTFLMGKTKMPKSEKIRDNVEVHIFNFNQFIYGENLEILFIKKIRNELKFDSAASLVAQIRKDIKTAKRVFSRHNSIPQYLPHKAAYNH